MFWLDPHTVPTIGDNFRLAGYSTFWKGKWHAAQVNITIPGTHEAFSSYDSDTGVPVPASVRLYENADNLAPYGFNGWVGPEPHGSDPRNSGASDAAGLSGRDVVCADEAVDLIQSLEQQRRCGWNDPWLSNGREGLECVTASMLTHFRDKRSYIADGLRQISWADQQNRCLSFMICGYRLMEESATGQHECY